MDNVLRKIGTNNRTVIETKDDFTRLVSLSGTTLAGEAVWNVASQGAAAAVRSAVSGVNSTTRALGVLECHTGTGVTGRGGAQLSNGILFGYAFFRIEWRVWIGALSTVAQEFTAEFGWLANATVAGDNTNGPYFQYDRINGGDFWRIASADNSVRTKTTTSVPIVASQVVNLAIEVNTAGTLATYFVNDVPVGTIATNIPATPGTTRETAPGMKITKSSGTTAVSIFADRYSQLIIFSSPR